MVPRAHKQAAEAGLDGRVTLELVSAQNFADQPHDLTTSFDCLHDVGDPAGAARHIRQLLLAGWPGQGRGRRSG